MGGRYSKVAGSQSKSVREPESPANLIPASRSAVTAHRKKSRFDTEPYSETLPLFFLFQPLQPVSLGAFRQLG
jgi:hypothetical protein